MTKNEAEEALLGEAYEVLDWRIGELMRAGYPEKIAIILALNVEVDIHQAAKLIRDGCSVKTALRILK